MTHVGLLNLQGTALLIAFMASAQDVSPSRATAQNLDTATPTSAAPAQANGPKAPAGYEQAVELAFKEFEIGNYPEARTRFLEAHKLFPNARTYRALGMVEYELRNWTQTAEPYSGNAGAAVLRTP